MRFFFMPCTAVVAGAVAGLAAWAMWPELRWTNRAREWPARAYVERLHKCDPRVPSPPSHGPLWMFLREPEVTALRMAAETCRPGELLPGNLVDLGRRVGEDLAKRAGPVPPVPSVEEASRLLQR